MQNNTEKTNEQQNQPETNPQFFAAATSNQMSQNEMTFFLDELITRCEFDAKFVNGLIFLLNSFEKLAETNPTELRERLDTLQRFAYRNSEDFSLAFSRFIETNNSNKGLEIKI